LSLPQLSISILSTPRKACVPEMFGNVCTVRFQLGLYVQMTDTVILGAAQEAIKLLPFESSRNRAWSAHIQGVAASTAGSTTTIAPPPALLVGSARMPSGSLTHVRLCTLCLAHACQTVFTESRFWGTI
jgi:hypothetical protein